MSEIRCFRAELRISDTAQSDSPSLVPAAGEHACRSHHQCERTAPCVVHVTGNVSLNGPKHLPKIAPLAGLIGESSFALPSATRHSWSEFSKECEAEQAQAKLDEVMNSGLL
jgi:hypothetical protein